jgi:hypothetical protein
MRGLAFVIGMALVTALASLGGGTGRAAMTTGETGAFGSGTLAYTTGTVTFTVDATSTGDGVKAVGTIRMSSPGSDTMANALCVRNVDGLTVVGGQVTQTTMPAGPGPGMVLVIMETGPGVPDRIGYGFEPAPMTAQTSDCEVSPKTFPMSTLSSGDFTLVKSPPPVTATAPATTPQASTTTTASAARPLIAKPVASPRPRAGKPVLVTFAVTRSDTGAPLRNGKMICDPSVSGKLLAHVERFTNGRASVRFTIPKTAKGRLLEVRLTVQVGTEAATRLGSFPIG